jgi:hypothetical protein
MYVSTKKDDAAEWNPPPLTRDDKRAISQYAAGEKFAVTRVRIVPRRMKHLSRYRARRPS